MSDRCIRPIGPAVLDAIAGPDGIGYICNLSAFLANRPRSGRCSPTKRCSH